MRNEQIKSEILQSLSIELDALLVDISQNDNIQIQENRNKIEKNLYVSHLGGLRAFLKKLEHYSDVYKKKVCIAMGQNGYGHGQHQPIRKRFKYWIFFMHLKN